MEQYSECTRIHALKATVKKWEASFTEENGRKPNKEDMRRAPVAILDAYSKYRKMLKEESKEESLHSKDSDVWSSKLNKTNHKKCDNSISYSMLQHFSGKLRNNSLSDTKDCFTKRIKHFSKKNINKVFCINTNEMDHRIQDDTLTTNSKESFEMTNDLDGNLKNDSERDVRTNNLNLTELSSKDLNAQNQSSIPLMKYFNSVTYTPQQYNSFHSINLLNPSMEIHQSYAKKFKIDNRWLERCNVEADDNYLLQSVNVENGLKCLDSTLVNSVHNGQTAVSLFNQQRDVPSNILETANTEYIKNESSISPVKECGDVHVRSKVLNNDLNQQNKFDLLTSRCSDLQNEATSVCNISSLPKNIIDNKTEELNVNGMSHLQSFKMLTKDAEKVDQNTNPLENNESRKRKTSNSCIQKCHTGSKKLKVSKKKKLPNTSFAFDNANLVNNVSEEKLETSIVQEHKKKKDLSNTLCYASEEVLIKKDFSNKRKSFPTTVNDNFVRINLKRKKYVRGYKHFSAQQYKKQKWIWLQKNKNSSDNSGTRASSSACFKCGKVGHWARQCSTARVNNLLPKVDEIDDGNECPLPTLEEAASLAQGVHLSKTTTTVYIKESGNEAVDETYLSLSQEDKFLETSDCNKSAVHPLFEEDSYGKCIATPSIVFEALTKMGFSSFKPGQEEAVMRILSGLSTLVVLPTGSGKSLCYQLPSYLYAQQSNSITLVISPLVALMEDQASGFPSCLQAVCLHSGMSDIQRKKSIEDITLGKAHVLLVSPEAIVGSRGCHSVLIPANLPPIAFACIDEVHCLSEWSHNFRPSYLQLYKVLRKKFGVSCFLGLTATATCSTVQSIAFHLNLHHDSDAVVGQTSIPLNLCLSVSRDKYKDEAVINILCGQRFCNLKSIIIYCTRREETERLAVLIRTCLQDEHASCNEDANHAGPKRKELAYNAEAYHAGLSAFKRRSIQKRFMKDKLRIVVATVAFGMGLNKADVRGIIHYNMPKSFESYVQEIGRAGRNGMVAHCHLFLDAEGQDLPELKRHIYANSTDRYVIRKLLKKIFKPCHCQKLHQRLKEEEEMRIDECELQDSKIHCPGHEVAFSIESAVQDLDMKEENIATLLSYLELHSKSQIEILKPVYSTCIVRSYTGAKQLRLAARKNPPLAVAMILDQQNDSTKKDKTELHFPVIEVASYMGWDSGLVKKALKKLQWDTSQEGSNFRKTGILVEFSNLAFHVRACGNLTDDELDEMLNFLYKRVITQESHELNKLQKVFDTFKSVSCTQYWSCADEADETKSNKLKEVLNKYFEKDTAVEEIDEYFEKTVAEDGSGSLSASANLEPDLVAVRADVRDLICIHHDHNFTGRAIARILYGISSPQFPAEVWGRVHRFWRSHLGVDFNTLINIANQEILKLKGA